MKYELKCRYFRFVALTGGKKVLQGVGICFVLSREMGGKWPPVRVKGSRIWGRYFRFLSVLSSACCCSSPSKDSPAWTFLSLLRKCQDNKPRFHLSPYLIIKYNNNNKRLSVINIMVGNFFALLAHLALLPIHFPTLTQVSSREGGQRP